MITCTCGSPDYIACDPGDSPEISPASDIVVSRGRPLRAWCQACWPHRPRLSFTLRAEIAAAVAEAGTAPLYRGWP